MLPKYGIISINSFVERVVLHMTQTSLLDCLSAFQGSLFLSFTVDKSMADQANFASPTVSHMLCVQRSE